MNKKLTAILESDKKVSKSEYIFSESGKPYGDIKTGWWTALKKSKIENFRFHDCRHTFGTRLGMAGVDIRTIQELMGHKDIKMTMRYSHPTPEHKRKALEILDRVTSIFTTQANPDRNSTTTLNSFKKNDKAYNSGWELGLETPFNFVETQKRLKILSFHF